MTTLHFKCDRITLSSALTPHLDYKLETAVACTFTIDFESVLSVFQALGMRDEIPTRSPQEAKLLLLRGIDEYADKISFFCSDCAISVPRNQKVFAGLMDKCIFEVNPTLATQNFPKTGIFHPKVWILLYTPDKLLLPNALPYIKVIISSSNLKKNKNLDYTVALEAPVVKRPSREAKDRNKPLIDWLNYLQPFAKNKQANIEKLKEAVLHTDKFLLDRTETFNDYQFYPLGISSDYTGEQTDLISQEYPKDWLIVVSPFIGTPFIQDLTNNGTINQASLLTRQTSLTKEIDSCFDNVYGLRTVLNNDELIEQTQEDEVLSSENSQEVNTQAAEQNTQIKEESEEESESDKREEFRDIHAKIYIYKSGKQKQFWCGSANATSQAFSDNIEFMLNLQYIRSATYEKICQELFMTDENGTLKQESPFEEIEPDENDTEDEDSFEIINRREIAENILSAEVEPETQDNLYTIVIRLKEEFDEPVQIAPYYSTGKPIPLTKETRLSGLKLEQLSNFYVIITESDRFVKLIETQGIPAEARNNAIIDAVIATKEDCYKIIELILSNVPSRVVANWDLAHINDPHYRELNPYIPHGIYEQALQIAATKIEPFWQLTRLAQAVSSDKLDPQLKELIEVFQKVVEQYNKTNPTQK